MVEYYYSNYYNYYPNDCVITSTLEFESFQNTAINKLEEIGSILEMKEKKLNEMEVVVQELQRVLPVLPDVSSDIPG